MHKKFAPILIACQRWRHNEKAKTGIIFSKGVILAGGFFKKFILFKGVSFKKIKLYRFAGGQYGFK